MIHDYRITPVGCRDIRLSTCFGDGHVFAYFFVRIPLLLLSFPKTASFSYFRYLHCSSFLSIAARRLTNFMTCALIRKVGRPTWPDCISDGNLSLL